MRILMAHWTLRVGGGAQVVMAQVSEHLRGLRNQVDIVTTVTPGAAFQEFKGGYDSAWHCSRSRFETPAAYVGRFRDEIGRRGYDCLITHHSLQAVAAAGTLPTSIRTVSVIQEHPISGSGFVGLSNPGAFDVYVGVSNGVSEAIRKVIGESRRIVTIRNGACLGDSPLRPKRETLQALFVGRLTERQKGILMLPRIIRQARNRGIPIELTVIGDGEDRQRLIGEIAAQEVGDRIILRGTRPQSEVFARMQEADVLLSCSRSEGLPLVLAEAMSRGCVPIATELRDSSSEVITSGIDGFLIRERSAESFVDAIETAWKGPGVLQAMRDSGHRKASEMFSSERMTREYAELLRQIEDLPEDRPRGHRQAVLDQI